ncbi:hypothetical protein KFE25_010574 [Diacronema lutheri]|uniref:Glutamate/phenylalanine/leucine/valine/L-tryptophan dehydrogenase C-terminal domain-containing protein n=2 Tax=Diacronema lutheri TaxID=2081491 RepID=A0A8J5XI05_DIALT|nr:hypothetical protein KFE25_010574 [Diacronema lutheri]
MASSGSLSRIFGHGHANVARLSTASIFAARTAPRQAPALPSSSILEATLPNGLGTVFVGISGAATLDVPGNGGLRLWSYPSLDAARAEVRALADGMARKHAAYGTGFAGAKLVCAASKDVATFTASDKHALLDSVAWVLDQLRGQVYTGCDLNISVHDMAGLAERSPYVLAALPNLDICPNATTAHGVVGAVSATFDGNVRGRTFLVHGCGAVGSVVATELRDAGARVLALDMDASRSRIRGVEQLAPDARWWEIECDAVVPCSSSYLVDVPIAASLRARALVGATNLLFSEPAALETVVRRGIIFVPESVSSAGAVIGDSIEHHDARAFTTAQPDELYAFVRRAVARTTAELLATARALDVAPSSREAFAIVALAAKERGPVGLRFRDGDEGTCASADAPPAEQADSQPGLLAAAAVMRGAPAAAAASATGGARGVRRFSSPSAGANDGRAPAMPSARGAHTARAGSAPWGFAGGAAAASTADVVIAGAGIMGLNIAYQLKRRAPEMRVVVLERERALGHGSSGYSTGFQRAYYSFDETMQLALDGMAAYKDWRAYTRLADAAETFVQTGALWMLGKPRCENDAMVVRLARYGIRADVLDERALAERFPLISTAPFPAFDADGTELAQDVGALSAVYEHGCGHVDPNACLADMLAVCRREGAEVRLGCGVEGLLLSADGSRCEGVATAAGERIAAPIVVNAMGPWFEKLMRSAGVTMSTTAKPTRIQVAHKHVPDEYLELPFTADSWGPSGIYFMPRRQSRQLVFGSVAHRFESEVLDEPDACNPALDPDVKQDYLACLLHRLPGLPQSGEVSGFSSMYTVNQDDVHPMIGETGVQGLWACNGFSGHGFKLAPAVGALVAQQITGLVTREWDTSIPRDFMSPHRAPLTLKTKTHFA